MKTVDIEIEFSFVHKNITYIYRLVYYLLLDKKLRIDVT